MNTIRPFTVAVLALALAPGLAEAQRAPLIDQTIVDRTVQVRPDARLELHNGRGAVVVRTWDRSAVHVVGRGKVKVDVQVETRGSTLVVHAPRQMPHNVEIDYEVTVPRAMGLQIHGIHGSVSVIDVQGPVEIHTVNGNVVVRGGRDRIEVHSVQGLVEVTGARGRVTLNSVNRGVVVRDVTGEVRADVVNGKVELRGIDSRRVEATTVNGPIVYDGTVHRDGSYRLSTHNGRIVMSFPEDTSARVQISTFNGSVHSRFPVQLREVEQGKRFDFTLGSGDARVELTSFNGTIELRRP